MFHYKCHQYDKTNGINLFELHQCSSLIPLIIIITLVKPAMKIFDKLKNKSIVNRKSEELLYSIVAQEMEAGIIHSGLWLKALQLANGDKEKQVSEYIRIRVQSLKDDVEIVSGDPIESRDISLESRPAQQDLDIEYFVKMINKGASIDQITGYLSGFNNKSIEKFINQQDAGEDYPLHLSIKQNRLDIAKWLIEMGASLNAKNYWGMTPLEVAVSCENNEAASLIRRHLLW